MQQIILALLLAFLVALALGPLLIPMLKRLKFGQTVRDDGPQTHLSKTGTPTMGGLMMLAGILVGTLSFTVGSMDFALPALLVTFAYGLVGFLDDFIKVRRKRSLGLRAYQKIIGQFGIAFIVALYAYNNPYIGSRIFLPFTGLEWDMGIYYIPFVMFVMIGTVNAVNLTDGLDGLASSVTFVVALGFIVIASLRGFAGTTLFSTAIASSLIGFLFWNFKPARVFMGDTGSMFLGGAVVAMAFGVSMQPLMLLSGIVYVGEAFSVMLQVTYFKLTHGKRIFKMSPIHHHFEMCGWSEEKIIAVFCAVAAVGTGLSIVSAVIS